MPRCRDVANRLTRVPTTLPPLDRTQLRLLPVADTVMALMWSRPGGLSLRTTWVTPATIWLCVPVSVLAGLLGIGIMGYGLVSAQPLLLLAGVVAVILAVGTGTVAIYGIRQRLLARRSVRDQAV
jgi:hypothetical protein